MRYRVRTIKIYWLLNADIGDGNLQTIGDLTNRMAHLYYLRVLNGINVHLLFVNFINDSEMKGPGNKETWDACYQIMEAALGLKPKHPLSKNIHHVVIDVKKL